MNFPEVVRRIRAAGLSTQKLRVPLSKTVRELPDLSERIRQIEVFFTQLQQTQLPGMLFFLMYDIEDHKVRRHLAKYLLKHGCIRMQKSVFLGRASLKVYREISDTVREINQMYDNGDSILVLPVTQESMTQLGVIGKNIDYRMTVMPPKVLIV